MTAMAQEVWTNQGQGLVTVGGTTAPSPGTLESWTVNVSAAFAASSSSASPLATIWFGYDPAAPSETLLVTTCPGGTGTGQNWQVVRGADGSTPVAHLSGFTIIQCVARDTMTLLQNRGPLWLTGGGTITASLIAAATGAGYQSLEIDSKNVWVISSSLSFSGGPDNLLIRSTMCGSNGYNGVVAYNTGGYINVTAASADGIQIYGTSGNTLQGIVFEGCVIVGDQANAVIHFGGYERQCGLRNCMVINTSNISTTVAAGSSGSAVSSIGGTLNVASASAFPSSGQAFIQTTNKGSPGLALIAYTGKGSATLTGVTLVSSADSGAGTMSTSSVVAPPQAAVINDTALGGANSEDQFFDHVQLASTGTGIAYGVDLGSVSGHANDTGYTHFCTISEGGLASIVGTGGGGHVYVPNDYDRAPAATGPQATVWNDGSVFLFVGGEDQNNVSNGVAHLVSGSGVTVCSSRNMSLATGGNTAVATVTGGVLKAAGRCRWSGIINVAGTGTVDLSDPSGWFNNSGAGNCYVSGSAGTLLVAGNYPGNVAGPPVVTGSASAPVAAAFTGQILLPFAGGQLSDGSDGAVHLTTGGASTGYATNAAGTWTLTRDLHATSIVIDSGVTFLPNGWRYFHQGVFILNGVMSANGGNASGTNQATAGASPFTVNATPLTGNAGAGGVASGTANGGNNVGTLMGTGSAGAGGNGSSGSGGAGVSNRATSDVLRPVATLQSAGVGWSASGFLRLGGAPTGGGGNGDGTNKGGGSGGGGGVIAGAGYVFVNNGTVNVNGGNGGTPVTTTGGCGGGAAGPGGLFAQWSVVPSTMGTVNASPGTAGSGVGTGTAGAAATAGSAVNMVLA